MKLLSNWGNYPKVTAEESQPHRKEFLSYFNQIKQTIPRGLGRSYGDCSLNRKIISTLGLNRIIYFDDEMGIIECESGVSLKKILEVVLPNGWFLPVTPGTKFVTIGGAVSSDVHGKNHHKEGSFSEFILSMELLLPSGEKIKCSINQHYSIFRATCGGMGLTGIILNVKLKLKSIETAYIKQKTLKAKNFEEIDALFLENDHYTYSVAWMDCLANGRNFGRSILILGEHAKIRHLDNINYRKMPLAIKQKRDIKIPFYFPEFVLNKVSMRIANSIYFKMVTDGEHYSIIDYDSFFYPLDRLINWNKLYGKRGFLQYQFVIPDSNSIYEIKHILLKIREYGLVPYLVVLKKMGKENNNIISFPLKGFTVALDFPIFGGIMGSLNEIDKIVHDYGGRLYLAKDARMGKLMFQKGYYNYSKFIEIKRRLDKNNKMQSLQSKRIGIH